MKRWSLIVSSAFVLGLLAQPATAVPTPAAGGPAEILRYVGDASSATGAALGNGTCDVNGDDTDDVVVGAWFWDKAPVNNLGAAYVLLGGDDVRGGSLGDPEAVGAVRIDGETPVPLPASNNGNSVAFSVGCVGDVNGDGFDDIAISNYQKQRAYVVFGAEDFDALSLDSLGDRGFVVQAPADAGNFSFSLAPVGDLNGDGKDEFAIAEITHVSNGRTANGRVWVFAGRDDISSIDTANLQQGEVLLTVDGATNGERLSQIGRAGDVNGDGIDDFVLGGYTGIPWGSGIAAPGAAYVVFGGATGEIDAANLGTKGFAVYGPKRQRDRLGISVSAAGDIDADGKADLLIGADGVANATTGPRNGGAAVVLGSASTATVYTDPTAAGGQSVFTCPADETPGECATPTRRGYWINGAAASDATGYAVAGIGDVNGDEIPDLALGAYGYDPVNPDSPAATMSGAGAVWVVHGRTTGAVQNLAGLPEAEGYRIDGLKAGDRMGRQVGLVGDFDGNGRRDLAAGGDFASRPASQNGEVLVALFGRLASEVALGGPTSVRPGETATFTATVSKKVGSQAPLSEGTVDFTFAGASIDGCDEVPVTSGTATCVRPAGDETPAGDVVATFDGGDRLAPTASAAQSFRVVKDTTTTALTVSDLDPRAGQLVQLTAEVAGPTGPVAAGTVSFSSDGAAIAGCANRPVDSGVAQCTTSWPTRSERQVEAAFSGNPTQAASASGATTVAVGSSSVLRPDPTPELVHGTTPAPLTGEVRGSDDVPTGTVELREGGDVLATSDLDGGEYSLQLGATDLLPGAHELVLVYSGDDRTRPVERSLAVSVSKATTVFTLATSTKTLRSKKTPLTLAVSTRAGVPVTGKVLIRVNGATVRTLTLSAGKARVTLPPFSTKGTRTITALYQGSATVAATSATKTVVVK